MGLSGVNELSRPEKGIRTLSVVIFRNLNTWLNGDVPKVELSRLETTNVCHYPNYTLETWDFSDADEVPERDG